MSPRAFPDVDSVKDLLPGDNGRSSDRECDSCGVNPRGSVSVIEGTALCRDCLNDPEVQEEFLGDE